MFTSPETRDSANDVASALHSLYPLSATMKYDEAEQQKALPELNLYNFEEDEFAGSKYVLTSPRSLEACDMLNVKPLELIYKPLSEYQDEMREKGLTFQHAYNEYDKYEKDRQRKLRECRDYRDKMIRDNIFKNSNDPIAAYDGALLAAEDEYIPPAEPHNDIYTRSGSSRIPIGQPVSTNLFVNGAASRRIPIGEDTSGHISIGGQVSRRVPIGQRADVRIATNGKISPRQLDRDDSEWRTHPPFSERHLSKHGRTKSKLDCEPNYQSTDGVDTVLGAGHVANGHGDSVRPTNGFKSRFMRQKYGEEVEGGEASRREMTTSLPVGRDDAYQSAYTYHRRSYTTDGLGGGGGINRTSTPYDTSSARAKAIDRSFTSISDIPVHSPRDLDTEPRRRKTSSAYTALEKETAALRNLTSAYANMNISRSLSLTDLNMYGEESRRQRPVPSRARAHNRGYTSDEEYFMGYRRRDRTEEILARALERRQREIEADLRNSQLEYRRQVQDLRLGLPDSNITSQRLEDTNWRGHNSQQDRYLSPRSPRTDRYRLSSSARQYDYADETLADRTQRERRVELAREQAVRELEAARVNSRKCRLQSERVRKAFREALSMNESKWRAADVTNQREADNENSYRHVQDVLVRSLGSERAHLSNREHRLDNGYADRNTRREDYGDDYYNRRPHDPAEDVDYSRLRSHLRRDESALTEEAVRRHTLLSSLSSREAEDFDNYLAGVEHNVDTPRESEFSNRHELENLEPEGPGPLVYGDLVPVTTNGHLDPHINGYIESESSGEYIRRPKKPNNDTRRGKAKNKQVVEDEKVKEMKFDLEKRRKELTEKLKATARQTQELRAARLESERKERERRQLKANRRILKNSESNNRKKKTPQPSGRLTEQVRAVKSSNSPPANTSSPHDRDTFDKKVLKAELNNWVTTGQRSQRSRTLSANRNQSQFSLA